MAPNYEPGVPPTQEIVASHECIGIERRDGARLLPYEGRQARLFDGSFTLHEVMWIVVSSASRRVFIELNICGSVQFLSPANRPPSWVVSAHVASQQFIPSLPGSNASLSHGFRRS